MDLATVKRSDLPIVAGLLAVLFAVLALMAAALGGWQSAQRLLYDPAYVFAGSVACLALLWWLANYERPV